MELATRNIVFEVPWVTVGHSYCPSKWGKTSRSPPPRCTWASSGPVSRRSYLIYHNGWFKTSLCLALPVSFPPDSLGKCHSLLPIPTGILGSYRSPIPCRPRAMNYELLPLHQARSIY